MTSQDSIALPARRPKPEWFAGSVVVDAVGAPLVVYPAFLGITSPLELDEDVDGSHFDWDASALAGMKAQGYDGVVIRRSTGGDYLGHG